MHWRFSVQLCCWCFSFFSNEGIKSNKSKTSRCECALLLVVLATPVDYSKFTSCKMLSTTKNFRSFRKLMPLLFSNCLSMLSQTALRRTPSFSFASRLSFQLGIWQRGRWAISKALCWSRFFPVTVRTELFEISSKESLPQFWKDPLLWTVASLRFLSCWACFIADVGCWSGFVVVWTGVVVAALGLEFSSQLGMLL